MSTISRHRAGTVTAGQRSGGRFKQQHRDIAAAPDVGRTQWLSDEETRHAAQLMEEKFFPLVVMKHGRKAIRVRDEIIQDTIVDLGVRAQAMGLERLDASHDGLTIRIMQARAISNIYGGEHHTSATGLKALAERRTEIEAGLGRMLSSREISELADEVRMSFPPGRRPTVGYHEVVKVEGLESASAEIASNAARSGIAYQDAYPSEAAPVDETPIERALEGLKEYEGLDDAWSKKRARQELKAIRGSVWTMLQTATPGLPGTREMTRTDAQKHRKQLDELGGVQSAARSYLNGELHDQDAVDALFAPFTIRAGSAGFDDQEAVAQKLAATGATADKVWSSAAGQ